MGIGSLTVHEHRIPVKESGKWSNAITKAFKELSPSTNVSQVDLYNMGGSKFETLAGNEQRLIILTNSHYADGSALAVEAAPINGIENNLEVFLPHAEEGSVLIKSNELVIAEYIKGGNQLYILTDLMAEYNENNVNILRYIVAEFERLVSVPLTYRYSWKHTSDRDELTKSLTTNLAEQRQRDIDDCKNRLDHQERSTRDLRASLTRAYTEVNRLMRQIETDEAALGSVNEQLIKDLDLLAAHPKVRDVQIKDKRFHIFVDNIHAYDEEDNKYYIGNFRIELKPENCEVKFFGDNGRRGYWTGQDPHPHVSGSSGEACLGNIASTLAELSSRMEIYALALSCIDFLEAVNTSDPAGRRVANWDRVDKDGTIIKAASQVRTSVTDPINDTVICHESGEEVHVDNATWAYGHVDDDGDASAGRWVGDNQLHDVYSFDEEPGEYIRDEDDTNEDGQTVPTRMVS